MKVELLFVRHITKTRLLKVLNGVLAYVTFKQTNQCAHVSPHLSVDRARTFPVSKGACPSANENI